MENTPQDKRVDNVKERLENDLVDDAGQPAGHEQIADAVDSAAERVADAPVQEFVPLLVEHDAREQLREQGLRRELGDDDTGAAHTRQADAERGSIHLSEHQGLAMPRSE